MARKTMRYSTPAEIRKTLAKVANMVLNGEINTKEANTIILACNAILGVIRIEEQQRKIVELEKLLFEIETKR